MKLFATLAAFFSLFEIQITHPQVSNTYTLAQIPNMRSMDAIEFYHEQDGAMVRENRTQSNLTDLVERFGAKSRWMFMQEIGTGEPQFVHKP